MVTDDGIFLIYVLTSYLSRTKKEVFFVSAGRRQDGDIFINLLVNLLIFSLPHFHKAVACCAE